MKLPLAVVVVEAVVLVEVDFEGTDFDLVLQVDFAEVVEVAAEVVGNMVVADTLALAAVGFVVVEAVAHHCFVAVADFVLVGVCFD